MEMACRLAKLLLAPSAFSIWKSLDCVNARIAKKVNDNRITPESFMLSKVFGG